MFKILQSKPVEVYFDEVLVYIHQEVLDTYFITSGLNNRFVVEHKYTLTNEKRPTEETIDAIMCLIYGRGYVANDKIQTDIIIEFINVYIKHELQKSLFELLPDYERHDMYSQLYNYVYIDVIGCKDGYRKEIFHVYDKIISSMDFYEGMEYELENSLHDGRQSDIHKIFKMAHINIFKIICKKYKLYEPILIAKGFDISLLHKKLRYDSRDLK